MVDEISKYGWTAVPRDVEKLLKGKKNIRDPKPVLVSDTKVPDTPLAIEIQQYAKTHLPEETYNHSMRVYFYGIAITSQQFPEFNLPEETFFLTCMLHDIGTTDTNLHATLMSFEFYGGMIALQLLLKEQAPKAQAESVAEAVIRHQDLGEIGTISTVGLVIQLATVFDNMGTHPEFVHEGTIEDVVKHFPRKKWSSCFSKTIRKENGLKPWAHTTALGEDAFPDGVANNELMAPFE